MPPPPFPPNPPVPVDTLLVPTSPATIQGVVVAKLVDMGLRADLWPIRDVAFSIIVTLAQILAGSFGNFVDAVSAGWLPTATKGWLTWLALYMYGVTRTPATFATGQVTLTNNGGGSFTFDVGEATFQNSSTKATYSNTEPIALGPGPGTHQTLAVQATAQGSGSNAVPGAIDAIVTTMTAVTVSNAAPVLGVDAQKDGSTQLECWNAIAANSPFGPAQSFGYAVQTAVNSVTGLPVNIDRFLVSESSHTGQVTVWVASPAGLADPSDVVGVQNNVLAIARPPCVTPTTVSASTVDDTDAITVYVTATPGLVAAQVQVAIETAIDDYLSTYPIGGKTSGAFTGLRATAIDGVCFGAWPGVFDVEGTTDLALVPGQVAVNTTTVTVRIV
jgi:Baseplate J-like protein